MFQLSWHTALTILSFFAAIAGVAILLSDQQKNRTYSETTDRLLFLSSFAYWLVYCAATGAQTLIAQEWEVVLLSAKLTAVISYLLAATSVLSLPLHRFATRQPEES